MQTAKSGDHVLVHFVKRFNDGTELSSRTSLGEPLEMIIGTPHPRLRGLGRELVGLSPGEERTILIPAGVAFGRNDPGRVRRLARSWFPDGRVPPVGKRTVVDNRQGRARSGRVIALEGDVVVMDFNHPRAGQAVELSVELVAILNQNSPSGVS